jgi:hypothetical protein
MKAPANIMQHPVKDKIYQRRMIEETNYNTITNPINGYNRNPYLNKVVSAANLHGESSRQSGAFASAASMML